MPRSTRSAPESTGGHPPARAAGQRAGELLRSGLIAAERGRLDEAIRQLDQATTLAPDNEATWLALARCRNAARDADGAIAAFDRALILNPQAVEALVELSRLLAKRRLWAPAITLSHRALVAARGHRMAYLELAKLLLDAGQVADSLNVLEDRLRQAPNDAEFLAASGQVMIRLKRHDEAMARYRAALAIDPACRLAADGLTASLNRSGRIGEAIQVVADKQARWPDDPAVRSQALFLLNYLADRDPARIAAAHRAWGRWISERVGNTGGGGSGKIGGGPRIRVGYVSADLCRHSVAHFLAPVLAQHDRAAFEIFCYSVTPGGDDFTQRLAGLAEHWRDVQDLDDAALTRLIRADGIDLLVDLGGHTADNRLGVFARRAAPVQATWLGYPNTTGLPAMDFRITDEVADPGGIADPLASETLVRLPDGFLCYRAPVPATVAEPAPERPFTFGSFNHIAKINNDVLARWAAILAGSPGSRLLLKAAGLDSVATVARLREAFRVAGIAGERLLLRGNTADETAHFATYAEIDLALDPFPYNGTTTTCDALWMGVPVLTVRGDRHAARVGASLLQAIGRPDLVAETATDYVAKAITLAGQPATVRGWRPAITNAMRQSPLMDEPAFARKLEAAYRRMIADATSA